MDQPLGLGVIGVGTFGRLHARVFAEAKEARLVAVADLDEARAREVAETFDCTAYTDYREVLQREDVQAVSVCTTDRLHLAPVVAAAQAGKHILVEKPLATSVADCEVMIEAARSAGVKLMVGQILRFDPRYYAAYKALREGQIGELVHLFARRNNRLQSAERLADKTSVLFFLGVHDVDFFNWCIGRRVVRVYAEVSQRVLADSPDTFLALIHYADGPIASLEVSWVLPPTYPGRLDARLEMVGTQGTIFVDGSGSEVEVHRAGVNECLDTRYAPEVNGRLVGILRDELHHFIECIQTDRPPLVTGEEGRAAVAVICAIEESAATGKPVLL